MVGIQLKGVREGYFQDALNTCFNRFVKSRTFISKIQREEEAKNQPDTQA